MPLNAFIVRPFGEKDLVVTSKNLPEQLKSYQPDADGRVIRGVMKIGDGEDWKVVIDFDAVHKILLTPVLDSLNIRGEVASAVMVAGNIREDMFHRLITADLVIVDLTMHNANVFYELGLRQAFRDKYTFVVRSNLSDYPFDLQTDRYFAYDMLELLDFERKILVVNKLAVALRSTIMSYKPDSPVFKLVPNLEAEDRSRFIAVPDEFREEVERAHQLRLPEHLRMLAVECADCLWEVEGLREVGRAQFESNFIDDAKATWEQIVNRYPDDIEANTILSTVYQRRNDTARSEQALARISRIASLTANRQSQLRSLNGRNLKEEWIKEWIDKDTIELRQAEALKSPLLPRAYAAFEEAFKGDLNNSYAGLNALTLLVIQSELARKWPTLWQSIQRRPTEIEIEHKRRDERIGQLIAALELAIESEGDRLRSESTVDPWFGLLEASVACIVSRQPDYVAQLYDDARHFAPVDSERSMCRALEVYTKLEIEGCKYSRASGTNDAIVADGVCGSRTVGTIAKNVELALEILKCSDDAVKGCTEPRRILMFAGLRVDMPPHLSERRIGFPEEHIDEVKQRIKEAIKNEMELTDGNNESKREILFGLAAAAHGGDLLFHEACHEFQLPTRMCLALPRSEYIGRYVAPAGSNWVEKFFSVYRRVDEERNKKANAKTDRTSGWAINCLSDANELPRWLQGRPYYNVGRRNNLWMLQHAIVTANQLGENTEITLITLHDDRSELGIGGIGHLVEQAKMAGIKVKKVHLPKQCEPKVTTQSPEILAGSSAISVKPRGMSQVTPATSTITK
jgi:hypothetical protein